MAGWACACWGAVCADQQTNKHTWAGTALRGLRARVGACSQPGRDCSFSPRLFLFSCWCVQLPALPCPSPTAQLPPLPGWPQGRWPCWADPALTLLSLSRDNQDTCCCSGSAFPVSLRGPVQSPLPRWFRCPTRFALCGLGLGSEPSGTSMSCK